MAKITQKFVAAEGKKHSIIYKPAISPTEQPIASSVYIMRGALPTPAPRVVELTLDVDVPQQIPAMPTVNLNEI